MLSCLFNLHNLLWRPHTFFVKSYHYYPYTLKRIRITCGSDYDVTFPCRYRCDYFVSNHTCHRLPILRGVSRFTYQVKCIPRGGLMFEHNKSHEFLLKDKLHSACIKLPDVRRLSPSCGALHYRSVQKYPRPSFLIEVRSTSIVSMVWPYDYI